MMFPFRSGPCSECYVAQALLARCLCGIDYNRSPDTDPPPTDPCSCKRTEDELEEMFRAVEAAREREIAALRETVQLLEARCSGLTALLEAQRKTYCD